MAAKSQDYLQQQVERHANAFEAQQVELANRHWSAEWELSVAQEHIFIADQDGMADCDINVLGTNTLRTAVGASTTLAASGERAANHTDGPVREPLPCLPAERREMLTSEY